MSWFKFCWWHKKEEIQYSRMDDNNMLVEHTILLGCTRCGYIFSETTWVWDTEKEEFIKQ